MCYDFRRDNKMREQDKMSAEAQARDTENRVLSTKSMALMSNLVNAAAKFATTGNARHLEALQRQQSKMHAHLAELEDCESRLNDLVDLVGRDPW
jgi:hypothetical protein